MDNNKFILMGINDENSKNIAEILKSETAKKILDFLGDVKEASEKDISDKLNMPINTVEYNLKKLIKVGLVKSSKNFFWSVKGKKIPMYQLAKKHIIISPNKKPDLNYLKSILPVILIISALLIFIALFSILQNPEKTIESQSKLKKFNSFEELKKFLEENSQNQNYLQTFATERALTPSAETITPSVATEDAASTKSSQDYSQTNIQVEGVDEADIVKNDGKYIYLASKNKVYIIDAYPSETMKILSEIELNNSLNNIFVNNNKLIVFGTEFPSVYRVESKIASDIVCIGCGRYPSQKTVIYIYDITDKENPKLKTEIKTDGYFSNSRMIGDHVYLISTQYINSPEPVLPMYEVQGVKTQVDATEIYYFDYPDSNYVFTIVSAINLENEEYNSKIFLTGYTGALYVSKDNLYLTYQKTINYENYVQKFAEEIAFPILPDEEDEKVKEILALDDSEYKKLNDINQIIYEYSFSLKEKKSEFDEKLKELTEQFILNIQKETEKTIVHKINLDEDEITYQGAGEVPGRVLNQFSMDEYKGNFRIATTTGNSWQDTSLNHVYILDDNLEIIGKVEDLAKGETIYSTRFLGDKLYLVTFKQTDPFFVIDLSKPKSPEVLGYLKIPGFSNYLHPYDEDTIIGIGQESQNLKISLFDISDFQNPKETAKYSIKADYSYSNALYEHKSFLFDKEKNILVIPVSYNNYNENWSLNEYWQGAFVFDINKNSIDLKGKISHSIDKENQWEYEIQRALYIDDSLYTISNSLIKANRLSDISDINQIKLNYKNIDYERQVEA